MKRILSLFLLPVLLLGLLAPVPALAVDAGEARVVIGADLSGEEINTVYSLMGLTRGSVKELIVTNAEERTYLEGLIASDVIGTRSISSVYLRASSAGSGLSVTCTNIDWCTGDMYRSALSTAGIRDAEVRVAAPFAVSGTAALTGIYKAYEDITGTYLADAAKTAAADELIVTAQLADQVSGDDAVAIVNELKLILDETELMTDSELHEQIETVASEYGYTLDSSLVDRLTGLCRQLEGLSVSELQSQAEQFMNSLSGKAEGLGAKIAAFLQRISDFLANLF